MTPNDPTTAAEIQARNARVDAQVVALSADALHACKRAARTLTAYLETCGEKPLSFPQVNLIRAMHLAEVATGRPMREANQTMGMVAHFFTPMQMEFAVELLTECVEGEVGEGWAVLDELEAIAAEKQDH